VPNRIKWYKNIKVWHIALLACPFICYQICDLCNFYFALHTQPSSHNFWMMALMVTFVIFATSVCNTRFRVMQNSFHLGTAAYPDFVFCHISLNAWPKPPWPFVQAGVCEVPGLSQSIKNTDSFVCPLDCSIAERFSRTSYVGVSHMYELFKLDVLFPCKSLLRFWSIMLWQDERGLERNWVCRPHHAQQQTGHLSFLVAIPFYINERRYADYCTTVSLAWSFQTCYAQCQ